MAFLDIFPFTRGHFLVIPKHHGERLTDLPEAQQFSLIRTLDRMSRRVGRLAPDYNVALNAGAPAGQIVFHVHFHVIPRYRGGQPLPPPFARTSREIRRRAGRGIASAAVGDRVDQAPSPRLRRTVL